MCVCVCSLLQACHDSMTRDKRQARALAAQAQIAQKGGTAICPAGGPDSLRSQSERQKSRDRP